MRTIPFMLLIATSFGCLSETIGHDPDLTSVEQSFPEDLARAYCEAVFECQALDDCAAISAYDDVEACVSGERARLESAQAVAVDAGLIFDAQCVQETIERYTAFGCGGMWELGHVGGELFSLLCAPYHGGLAYNDSCEQIGQTRLSACGAGLFCFDEQCHEIYEACECDEGFACGLDSEVCLPIAEDGDLCFLDTEVANCREGSRCAQPAAEGRDWHCEPTLALGEPCSSNDQCESFTCEDDVCVEATPFLCDPELTPGKWED